ncbi:hypothetical protein DB30_01977 [Enhygromyxa salina]|uniref:ORC1/DEAH AAA+ ATPase domain-containing protein n=1 Tax=Enhygromyxa salina TaxID=215803 RepID=A0A0C2D904_9BACT|nr:AAA family ATPase [Enhygromyxa salina]KIG18090.1 hypothetical protein DB30_01977 [Enhygromyxa salina]
MQADPSGAVELGEVIGREADVDRLWTALVAGNVILTARAGVGKTTVARLAIADAPTGWTGRRVSLAGVRGPAAASAAIIEALARDPDAGETLRAAVASVLDGAGHVSANKLEGDPTSALRAAIEAQLDDRAVGLMLVLDDFDRFLSDAATEESNDLVALTKSLAELSGADTRVRLLLISNTHIDRTLARVRPPLSASLFERCARMTLDQLRPEAGARLVTSLLLGESITARDRAALARSLADDCDHVPRWIHCAVAHFVKRRKPIVDGDLERCMVAAVADLDREPWALRRELSPVLDEYEQPQRGIAFSVLDQLALAEERTLTLTDVRRQLAMETTIDEDAVRRVVSELCDDQLVAELGGSLQFGGELLRLAWLKLRFI